MSTGAAAAGGEASGSPDVAASASAAAAAAAGAGAAAVASFPMPQTKHELELEVLRAADRGDAASLRRLLQFAATGAPWASSAKAGSGVAAAVAAVRASPPCAQLNGGCTALHAAARSGHARVLASVLLPLLAAAEVSVDADEDVEAWTAAYYACAAQNARCAALLLRAGARSGQQQVDSFHGRSALDVAKHRQMHDVVAVLTRHGGAEGPSGARAAYARSAADVVAAAKRRGVMNGVHRKHKDKFMGRYVFVDPPRIADAVARVERFREDLSRPDVSFLVKDVMQPQFGGGLRLTLSHSLRRHRRRSRAAARRARLEEEEEEEAGGGGGGGADLPSAEYDSDEPELFVGAGEFEDFDDDKGDDAEQGGGDDATGGDWADQALVRSSSIGTHEHMLITRPVSTAAASPSS